NNNNNNAPTTTKSVNTDVLNVRSGPGTNHGIVGKAKRGEKLQVLLESNGWSKVNYAGKISYVSSSYLTAVNQPSQPKPEVKPDTPSDNNQNTGEANVNNNSLSYTLSDHVNRQFERISVGGNVIDSTKPRSSDVLTTFKMAQTRGFVNADKSDLEYFLNPENFRNSSKGMMQFLRLDRYRGGISVSELNSYLNSLVPASSGSNVFYNQGEAFINAAQKYNIDLVYLVSHAMWETGYGRSTLAQGQTLTSYKGQALDKPVKVYNFFGIGAIDGSANLSGAEASYSNGWTSIESTIDGSAKWIANGYIKSSKYNQNTVYKMKWNYDYTWHQYATDVNWANGISGIMNNLIKMYDTGSDLTFEIPKYK
ncbi:MAG: SH3 domain-containing protein, partial [Romboutsia sp.]